MGLRSPAAYKIAGQLIESLDELLNEFRINVKTLLDIRFNHIVEIENAKSSDFDLETSDASSSPPCPSAALAGQSERWLESPVLEMESSNPPGSPKELPGFSASAPIPEVGNTLAYVSIHDELLDPGGLFRRTKLG